MRRPPRSRPPARTRRHSWRSWTLVRALTLEDVHDHRTDRRGAFLAETRSNYDRGVSNLSLTHTPVATLDVDALVVGVFSDVGTPRLASGGADIEDAIHGGFTAALQAMGAKGSAEEVTKLPSGGAAPAPLVVAVGLGAEPAEGAACEQETLRRAAGAALRSLAGTSRVGLALPAEDVPALGAVAEGALLGAYAFLRYRDPSSGDYRAPVEDLTVVSPLAGQADAELAAARARTLTGAVSLVRDLVNTPPSDLHPQELVEVAAATAGESGLGIEVLDEGALREGGYGGLLGVGQGSVHPPRLARLTHTHPEATDTVAFVGKGITFDSGGLSLKPSASMEWMKSDMGGAAAVLGALSAIARLNVPVNAVGYLALAENMPSGAAQRPSDVLTIYGGKTVEVLNTDAEGRLVMADAIVRAAEDTDLIVDAATLTGAQITALGTRVAAAMANDDELRGAVTEAAERAGDAVWPMPLPEELRKMLDSGVADIANVSGDRSGSMLQAGVFLREFVPEGVRWAHLDIAGPAFNQGEAHGYTPKGGTGAATRTLVALAEDAAAGRL